MKTNGAATQTPMYRRIRLAFMNYSSLAKKYRAIEIAKSTTVKSRYRYHFNSRDMILPEYRIDHTFENKATPMIMAAFIIAIKK